MVPGELCDEDDAETDGGDDMTPSPPDYRSWRPLNGHHGHHQGQAVMQRMASMKRAAADAVDGSKAVKKAKVGGQVVDEGHTFIHLRRDERLGTDDSAHYI